MPRDRNDQFEHDPDEHDEPEGRESAEDESSADESADESSADESADESSADESEDDDSYDDGDDDEEDDDDDDEPQRPAVFITTAQPVDISVTRIEDERAPEGAALGAFIDGRLVARSAMPTEAIDRLLALGLFDTPVPLGLFAYEEEPGLQCRLFALVPSGMLEQAAHEDEPWKASVPSYEDRLARGGDDEEDGEDGPSLETILLGHIVRFAGDRKHPDDLAAEAVDILHKILTGGPLADANSKAIDDLLDSL